MKKTYIRPASASVQFSMESNLLGSSNLSDTGGDNLEFTPGNDEFEGTFRSQPQQDWGTSAWNED